PVIKNVRCLVEDEPFVHRFQRQIACLDSTEPGIDSPESEKGVLPFMQHQVVYKQVRCLFDQGSFRLDGTHAIACLDTKEPGIPDEGIIRYNDRDPQIKDTSKCDAICTEVPLIISVVTKNVRCLLDEQRFIKQGNNLIVCLDSTEPGINMERIVTQHDYDPQIVDTSHCNTWYQ
uniref:Uncharacterized protein n=1 Tax=Romanomermis culicivorax TaxID=13658 RepID=A0A915I8N2_ROMCU